MLPEVLRVQLQWFCNIGGKMTGIWEGTIYDNSPKLWGNDNVGAISTAINNNVNNKPTYGAISGAINDYVKPTNNEGFNWGTLGKALLSNAGGGGGYSGSGNSQTPKVSFNPTMAQPQYLNNDFQNQASYLANIGQNNNSNLFDYLMRK